LDPTFVGVNRHIAEAHRRRGDLEKAREYLLTELRGDAGNTELLCELGELALQAGDLAAAAGKFAQVLELDPEHIAARYAQGRIQLATGKLAEAIACFEQVEQVADPDEEGLVDFHLKFGEALMLSNRLPEARRRLDRALGRGEPSDELLMVMGNCLLSDGKPSEAAEYFRRVIARDAGHAFAHHHLGLAMMRLGRYESGLQHCLSAIEARPAFAVAMYNAAMGYALLGRWSQAREMLQRANKEEPNNELIARTLKRLWRMRIHFALRRFLGFFRRSLKLG
jgi:tetratricopeptide (TPR) repeat protein